MVREENIKYFKVGLPKEVIAEIFDNIVVHLDPPIKNGKYIYESPNLNDNAGILKEFLLYMLDNEGYITLDWNKLQQKITVKEIDQNETLFKKIYNFIDDEERKKWDSFVKKHHKHGVNVSGNGLSIELVPDSIGGYVLIMKCLCGKADNITNFDNW